MIGFRDYFLGRLESGGFTTEDALASFLPLIRRVVAAHEAGLVAPLIGVEQLQVEGLQIVFGDGLRSLPALQPDKIRAMEKAQTRAVEVVGEARVTIEVNCGDQKYVSLQVGQRGEEITRPVYLPGYISWEHELGHHDPLTDTFCLGLILASLTCGLDLNDPDQLALFVHRRRNIFDLNSNIHPVLAKAVTRMTELDRHRRPQDLSALLRTLENYRDQDIDFEFELARAAGFRETDVTGKRKMILSTLQKRLFEISRRNRLLNFRSTMQTVNLTVSSVPLSFDPDSIRPEQILTWNGEFHDSVVAGKPIPLNKYLRFEEATYLPGLLDHIRAEAQRDLVEFGFAQLRLVLCFLRWSNLKEKPPERFESPLILLPVRLVKKKGVRDTYSLEPLSTEAEVNPVLRFYFKELYDISLPEALDLTSTSLDTFHEFLSAQVQMSEPAVSVAKIDRPRIHLIHAKARRRLDQYIQRTRLSGRGIRTFNEIDYSYDKENFQPLGLRLFQTRIRRPDTNLESIIQRTPSPRTFMVPQAEPAPSVSEQDRALYSLDGPVDTNPYTWEFDLCSVTLGNFRYRKMSLVRDYAALLENAHDHPAFDALFSVEPREIESTPIAIPPLEEQYPVLTCDPTQTAAIARARTGKSYIIQGPPGTGKSQTIANLIADYASRGQRILFVCEKRAAIDVVFHRLRQHGLESLCALIHDSQEDKKAFITDLKQTYETLLEKAGKDGPVADSRRQELLRAIERDLKPLRHFHDAMCSPPPGTPIPLRHVLRRLVKLRESLPELSAVEKERVPPYGHWCEHHDRIDRLTTALTELQGDPIFANHPLKNVTPRLVTQQRPLEYVLAHLRKAEKLLDVVEEGIHATGLQADECDTLEKADHVIRYGERMRFLAEIEQFSLLQPSSESAKSFASLAADYGKKAAQLEETRRATRAWNQKLSPADAGTALEQARGYQSSALSFLKPGWWRLRGVLHRCYDFRSHQVQPIWVQILEALMREYEAERELERVGADAQHSFKFAGSMGDFVFRLDETRSQIGQFPSAVQAIHSRLLGSPAANTAVLQLAGLRASLNQLFAELSSFLDCFQDRTIAQLRQELGLIEESLDDLPDFVVCLKEAATLPPEFVDLLRRVPLPTPALEAAMAERTWEDVCKSDRAVKRFNGQARSRHIGQLRESYEQLYDANAAFLCEKVRLRFLENVRLSGLPHARLTSEQKELKTAYGRGRRELEHEFGKTMRYRSIRDLVSGDSGLVIQDLKPVWLMSPLSVSDTLPLDTAHFDVVIFDEASQITLEEAVPSLFRAVQVIVVGDQMQLPPTNFFSAKHVADESLAVPDEITGETMEYDLEGNSFLAQSARVLPSTMLGWHYRSRSESLISFSNAAFYQGQLLTVPESKLPAPEWTEIQVASADEGAANAGRLLERPISFHFLETGVYHNRRNTAEADYIAFIVRDLLSRGTGQSIGIIAFSEAQQGEIQDALGRLGREDPEFRDRLDAEFEREENGQFVGLLVKNLENIQGDERDIVILSVCYGHGPNGKMLMNFGPINQSGGEKRLNVAFSRAKQHMAVVSSIRHHEITNEYNDGARCFKNYLRYVEAISLGDLDTARRTLREMLVRPEQEGERIAARDDIVVLQLADALREHGYEIDLDVGHSSFRCDLGVRRSNEQAYCAGILVDTDVYYQRTDIIERDVMRPRLLESFGWKITYVLAKDWFQSPTAVVKAVIRFIEEPTTPEDTVRANSPEKPADLEPDEPYTTPTLVSPVAADRPALSTVSFVPQTSPPTSSSPVNWKRYFEFSAGTSHKFWEITVQGVSHTVRFGRIGSDGQAKTKTFADESVAERDARRLVSEKLAKGYIERQR
jgi:predicted DNA-binding WGR domain protein